MKQPTQFIAYVYPGWHANAFRGDFDEWTLFDKFSPYFDGHQMPSRPAAGFYDDSQQSCSRRQVQEAADAGINGFTYFFYYGNDGPIMAEPLGAALDAAAAADTVADTAFEVGTTWCLRLPHTNFPIPLVSDGMGISVDRITGKAAPDGEFTIGELGRVLGPNCLDQLSLSAAMRLTQIGPRQKKK